MARKRKVAASAPESSTETLETQPPLEDEQSPIEPQLEEQQEQQIEEPVQTNEEEIEPPQELPETEEQEDLEEGNERDTVNTTNDDASVKQDSATENGGDVEEAAAEEEEELEEEPVEKLLEPFSKEQLAVILKEAVLKFPEFIESVHKLADMDPSRRKIFVHGLGWDTTTETLTGEFGKYGEIEDCKAVSDKVSGKSKGYGFILFKNRTGARKALRQPQKMIGNRLTSCQLASAGPVPAPPPTSAAAVAVTPPVSELTQRKIFVSNVSPDIDPQKLLDFFSQYGEIDDGPLGLDKQTGKPKGFALFVYKNIESAKKALEEPHKSFEGHTLNCQRAIDGPKQNKPFFQQQHHHHHHQQPHQQYRHNPSKKTKYSSGGGAGRGHLMAPSGPPVAYNPAVANPALTPALGQALTALLASQGAGLGITNLLGGLGGGAPLNQGMPPMMNNAGYGNQGGGYGSQSGMQAGYQNPQMGQGPQGSSRPQQGGASYMGHGH